MVATASTEHSYWLALAFVACFVYATQAIAFEWKPGFRRPAIRLAVVTNTPLHSHSLSRSSSYLWPQLNRQCRTVGKKISAELTAPCCHARLGLVVIVGIMDYSFHSKELAVFFAIYKVDVQSFVLHMHTGPRADCPCCR